MSQTTDVPPEHPFLGSSDYSAPACAHRRRLALDNLSFLCSDTSVTIVTFEGAGGSWRAVPISGREPFIFPGWSCAFSNIYSENADEAIFVLLQATQRCIAMQFQQCANFHAMPAFRQSADGIVYDAALACVYGYDNELFTRTFVAPASSNLEDLSADAPSHASQPATDYDCFPKSNAHENLPQTYWTKRFEYPRSKEGVATEYSSSLATVQYTEPDWSCGLVPYNNLIEFQELEQRELDAELFAVMYHKPCRDWDLELYEESEKWMAQRLEENLMEAYEHDLDRDYEDPKWVELDIRLDISEREATANVDQHRRRVRPSEKRACCYQDRLPCEAEDECLYHREGRLLSEYLEAREALAAGKIRWNRPEAEQLNENLLAYERSENPLCEPLSRDYFLNILNFSKEETRHNHIQEWMQAQESATAEAVEVDTYSISLDSHTQHTRQNELPWAEAGELHTSGFSTTHWIWEANDLGREWEEWVASGKGQMRQTELGDAVQDGQKGEQQSKSTVGIQTEDCDMEEVSLEANVAQGGTMTLEEPELMGIQDDTQMEGVDDESDGTMAGNEEQVIPSSPSMSYDYEHGYYLVTPPATGRPMAHGVPFAGVRQVDSPQSPCNSESTYCIMSSPQPLRVSSLALRTIHQDTIAQAEW